MYVAVPTAPTLPATSVARCSSVCGPLPEIVTGSAVRGPVTAVEPVLELVEPGPPAGSAPASVTCTGSVKVPPSGVAVDVGTVLSILTVTVLSASTLPSASVERYVTVVVPSWLSVTGPL